jgi:hypothetical protein
VIAPRIQLGTAECEATGAHCRIAQIGAEILCHAFKAHVIAFATGSPLKLTKASPRWRCTLALVGSLATSRIEAPPKTQVITITQNFASNFAIGKSLWITTASAFSGCSNTP